MKQPFQGLTKFCNDLRGSLVQANMRDICPWTRNVRTLKPVLPSASPFIPGASVRCPCPNVTSHNRKRVRFQVSDDCCSWDLDLNVPDCLPDSTLNVLPSDTAGVMELSSTPSDCNRNYWLRYTVPDCPNGITLKQASICGKDMYGLPKACPPPHIEVKHPKPKDESEGVLVSTHTKEAVGTWLAKDYPPFAKGTYVSEPLLVNRIRPLYGQIRVVFPESCAYELELTDIPGHSGGGCSEIEVDYELNAEDPGWLFTPTIKSDPKNPCNRTLNLDLSYNIGYTDDEEGGEGDESEQCVVCTPVAEIDCSDGAYGGCRITLQVSCSSHGKVIVTSNQATKTIKFKSPWGDNGVSKDVTCISKANIKLTDEGELEGTTEKTVMSFDSGIFTGASRPPTGLPQIKGSLLWETCEPPDDPGTGGSTQ